MAAPVEIDLSKTDGESALEFIPDYDRGIDTGYVESVVLLSKATK